MSVYCDKFIGYSIDIKDKWDSLSEDEKEKWLENFNNKKLPEYDKFKFTPYYNKKESLLGRVTVLYDGMCGQYCKLIYVKDYELRTDEENSTHIIDSINKVLSESPVPFSVKQAIKNVYKEMFNEDLNTTSNIKAEYIIHWH